MKGIKFLIRLSIFIILAFYFVQSNISAVSYYVNFTKEDLSFGLEREFQNVSLVGCNSMGEIGKPQLPAKYIHLIIPKDKDVDSIIITNQTNIQVQGSFHILPAQHAVPYSDPPIVYTFVEPDPVVYNSSQPFPGKLAEVVRHDLFDGCNRIATIAIYPLQYQPAESTITLYTSLSLNLSLKPSQAKAVQPKFRLAHLQRIYDNMLRSMVDNPEDIPNYGSGPQTMGGGGGIPGPPPSDAPYYAPYLIITVDSLKGYFTDYISWMWQKEFKCTTVTVSKIREWFDDGDEISGINDVAGSIRQYLYHGWQNGTVYALLAGVAKGLFPSPAKDVVPIRVGAYDDNPPAFDTLETETYWKWIPTDLYYSDLNGNWEVDNDGRYGEPIEDLVDYAPEIFVGRLPCINGKDIENWIEKVIHYEIMPGDSDFTYLTRHLCCQADEAQEDKECSTVQYRFSTYGWNTSLLEEVPQDPHVPSSPTGTEVIDSMNSDYGFIDWHHHGKPTAAYVRSIWDPWPVLKPLSMVTTFDTYPDTVTESSNGMDNLTNEGKYAVLYETNCYLAAYDIAHYNSKFSISEGFTILGKRGGPCFLGHTRRGYEDRSIEIEKFFLDTLFTNDFSLGEAEAYSKSAYSGQVKGHELAFSHNLIGDPQLHAWCTPCPNGIQEFVVTYHYQADEVTVQDTSGNYLNGVLVCISNEQNGYWFTDTTINGIVKSAPEGCSYDLDTNDVIVVTEPSFLPSIRRMGYINQNTTWSGLVILSGDIIIKPGRTLAIEPGTKILFEQYDEMSAGEDINRCEIKVLGKLIAKGTEDDSIFFGRPRWSANSIPNWYGIVADYGGVINIEYAEIKNAYAGLHLKPGSKDTVLHCMFRNNDYAGIINSSNGAQIAHNIIDRDPNLNLNAKYGVYLNGLNTGSILLHNTIKNYKYGICAVQCTTTFVSDTVISGAPTVSTICGIYVSSHSKVGIKECEIYGDFDTSYVYCDSSRIDMSDSKLWGAGSMLNWAVRYVDPDSGAGRRNIINDFVYGVSSLRGSPPDWGRDTTEFTSDSAGNNCFIPPQAPVYFIKNEACDDTFYAQLNWWGHRTVDPSKFHGPVRYIPFLHEEPEWIPQKIVFVESVSPFKLLQNYPNPFNPTTDIQYALPTDCEVKLVIYNILGQKVKTLVNEHQTTGFKTIRWDGKTDKGLKVSTGIYLYKLQAGEFTETKKMLLLK